MYGSYTYSTITYGGGVSSTSVISIITKSGKAAVSLLTNFKSTILGNKDKTALLSTKSDILQL